MASTPNFIQSLPIKFNNNDKYKSKQTIITQLIGISMWLLSKLKKKNQLLIYNKYQNIKKNKLGIYQTIDIQFNALAFHKLIQQDIKKTKRQQILQETNETTHKRKNKKKKKKAKNSKQKMQIHQITPEHIKQQNIQMKFKKLENMKKTSSQKRQENRFKNLQLQASQIQKKQDDSRQKVMAYYKIKTARGKIQQRKRQLYLFPKNTKNKQSIQQKNQRERFKNECIRQQLQLIQSYFLDQLQTIIPYTGNGGFYQLKIIGTQKQITLKWQYNSQYPYQLLDIELKFQGFNLLEKQKINSIQKQIKQRNQELIKKNKIIKNLNKNQNLSSSRKICTSNNALNHANHHMHINNHHNEEHINEKLQQNHNNNYENHQIQKIFYIFELATALLDQLTMLHNYAQQQKQKERQKQRQKQIMMRAQKSVMSVEQDRQALQQIRNQFFYLRDFHQDPDTTLLGQHHYQQQIQPTVQYMRGRYLSQFEQIQQIGQGGFGKVYRVRNKLDSTIYAVKKIIINYQDSKQRKLIKQVGYLSKLNHPNIVRYHQSWLQDATCFEQLYDDMSINGQTQQNQLKSMYKDWDNDQHGIVKFEVDNSISDEDQNIIFGYGDQSISYAQNSMVVFERESEHRQLTHITEHLKEKISSNSKKQFPFKILYIVMEFCQGITLKEYISKYGKQGDQRKVQIIRGILQGLTYIHNKKIIHRDLKPANIFLDLQKKKPKIGDFGLATTSNAINITSMDQKSLSLPIQLDLTQKTKGVGTPFYRAPQQIKLGKYDQKVDMYSLGIIMFEMWYPFDTYMQRFDKLTDITKTHKLPKDFYKWGARKTQIQQQIQSLLNQDPVQRPSAHKLLQTFRNKYFTQLVSCIANPKHFQFYQLLKHLFSIRNQYQHIIRKDLYKNYVVGQLTKIYQEHRGVLYTPIPLNPVTDYQMLNGTKIPQSRRQKFLLLSQKGVLLQYSQNSFYSWFKMAKQTFKRRVGKINQLNDQQLRRYTYDRVAQYNPIGKQKKDKDQYSFKEKFVTGFDIAYSLENGINLFYFIEMLKISTQINQTQNLTQLLPPIYLCHSKVYICIAKIYKLPLEKLYSALLSTTQEKFAQMPQNAKIDSFHRSNIDLISAKRICTLLETEYQNVQEWLQAFKISSPQFTEIQDQVNELQSFFKKYRRIFNLPRILWKLQIPPNNCHGLFWSNGPVKGYTSIQQISQDSQMLNIHLQMSLLAGQNQPDVSIWCNGQYLQEQIMKILQKCWVQGVKAKWYNQSIGQKDQSCKHNIIILKKNGRIYLSLRNNHEKRQTNYIRMDQCSLDFIGSMKIKKNNKNNSNNSSDSYQIS